MDQLKTLLKWIGLPFVALAGAIFYLTQKNRTLQDEVKDAQADRLQDQLKAELKEMDKDAQAKEDAYHAAAAQYEREHGAGADKLPGSDSKS